MPKFCANLSFLFTELPFPQRFAAAAAAGFDGVEYLSPYDYPAEQVAQWLRAAGVQQVLFNLPAGNWAAGERGLACLPGREDDFAESVELALAYAQALDCQRVHCMAGLNPLAEAPPLTRARYVKNLRHCADRFASIGAMVTIEAINTRIDMPGYWLDSVDLALELLAEIDRPNVKLQLDLYHAHIIGADSAAVIQRHLPQIGHVQLADHPGRHEPGTGEIPLASLLEQLDAAGYEGWVGCEYRPLTNTNAGLGWRNRGQG